MLCNSFGIFTDLFCVAEVNMKMSLPVLTTDPISAI